MNDLVFLDAVYWFFTSHDLLKILFGSLTFTSLIVSLFFVIRKWGDV